jgi:hypothetical protein
VFSETLIRRKTTKYLAILCQVENIFPLLCVLSFVISFFLVKVLLGLAYSPLIHFKSFPFMY